jgi:hypothetical protein
MEKKDYIKPEIFAIVLEPNNTLVTPCKCAQATSKLGAITWWNIGTDCYNSYYHSRCNTYSRS